VICGAPKADGSTCQQPRVQASADHRCVICSTDPAIIAKRLAGNRRGGDVAAINSRLASPKRALRYLATFAARLETDTSPEAVNAVQTAQRVVETALRLMNVDRLEAENAKLRTLLAAARPDLVVG